MLSLQHGSGSIEVLLPEGGEEGNFTFGSGLNDGAWHTVVIRPSAGQVIGEIDGVQELDEYLEDNSTVANLAQFLATAEVVVGSSSLGDTTQHFRGCMQEVRLGGVLLPFLEVNSTAGQKFVLEEQTQLTMGECVLCYEQECQNQGECSQPSEQFECSCPAGFSGSLCEVNIDECFAPTAPCVHGQCEDGVNNYTCSCQPGWTGWLCDQDLDECEAQPCRNNGTCSESAEPGDYTCACLPEYKGKDCQELKVKTCREQPCVNGGTCIEEARTDGPEQYRCDCPNGYEGINCEKQTDFCVKLNVECQNGGTCSSDFSRFNFHCQCRPGYEGLKCETETDECAGEPCRNGGRCIDKENRFDCDCTGTGFSGITCQSNINECLINRPCENGARCNDTQGSWDCQCSGSARGFCGKNCHVRDPCNGVRTNPIFHLTLLYPRQAPVCQNEGLCLATCDQETPYTCSCGEGWEGRTCNLKVRHCTVDFIIALDINILRLLRIFLPLL